VTKNLLLTAVAVISMNAFAAEGSKLGSEYLFQLPADKMAVTPSFAYNSMELDYKSITGLTGAKATGTIIGARGEYGISEMFSTGLVLSSTSDKSKYSPSGVQKDTSASGLDDLVAFFNGRMDMGSGSFRFGTDVVFSLEKEELNDQGNKTNQASGGMGVRPFVGYEMYAGPCTFGTKLSYLMYLGDRKGTDKSSTGDEAYTMSGSQMVIGSLFYEHNLSPLTLGASFEWESSAKEETTYTTSKTKSETGGVGFYRLNVYTPYEVSPMITILPQLTWGKLSAYDKTVISGGEVMNLQVAARFTF